ncbi:MAG TPA: EAL domain-containing protein [Ilumatobacteraceae bacterium]|jgi:diguanylate cyclase (GGDEF)-like protein|nr:EAL domain-containing protein [Ilumatobacteraceae bacterium]
MDTKLVELPESAAAGPAELPTTLADALLRMSEAEDMLRAIAAGEVDAFVVSDGRARRRVFTLSTADRPYRIFVENMRDGAVTLSSTGLILYANRRLAELLARPRASIVGSPLAMFVASNIPFELDEIRGPTGLGATVEFDLINSRGQPVPVLVGVSPLEVDGDNLTCLTFTDLSGQKAQDREISRLGDAQAERMADLQAAQAALTMQATHDSLTGLPNRNLLVDRIAGALLEAKRSRRCTAVLFVDLDRFKQINDTQGHAAGDTVLRKVAQQLTAVVRPHDTVARIGGDEFVVLAANVESRTHAIEIGNRLVAELSHRPGDADQVGASVGISVSIGGRGTAEILLNEADKAMYQAKSLGRGRVEVFDAALGRQVLQRSTAQKMLQSALDDHRVIAYYQPVIDFATGRIVGFEALARIAENDGSILPPLEFISVAEDSGLVVPLGTQVLEMACEEARRWDTDGEGDLPLTIAVNLSARQFEPGDLATVVESMLERTGLDPASLHLELTETAIIDLRPDILRQLELIRDLGVQIGLDDFGTGYASLTHLRRLPLSFVKIDQTFVQGIGEDQSDERIVSAVVDLAANLGLRSIAEGVETVDQLSRLRELGCDQGQGYLFARPLPPNDVSMDLLNSAW